MKLWILALTYFALPAVVLSQSVIYDNNAEKREIEPFTAIDASTGVEVLIAQGDAYSLAVSVTDKISSEIVRTVVEDGVLKISVENNWKFWNLPKNFKVKVYVSYVELEKLTAKSGATIRGSVKLKELKTENSSGGITHLNGIVERLDATAETGGIFRGYELQAVTLVADASTGGGLQVSVSKEVEAKASLGGFVNVKGDAVIKSINVNTGGSVKKVN